MFGNLHHAVLFEHKILSEHAIDAAAEHALVGVRSRLASSEVFFALLTHTQER
jgi:hypothetical protein